MIYNTRVYGLEESIIASGYPKKTVINDWGQGKPECCVLDKKRAIRLATVPSGTGHDCFLKGIIVQADFHMSQGWWMQAERYHWFDIVSSQSKEHNCRCLFGVDDPDDVKIGDKLTARVSTNYLQIKTMYKQRKSHRRQEWKEFCKWVDDLPMSEMMNTVKR